jgi:Polymer-forming cytoskeletal
MTASEVVILGEVSGNIYASDRVDIRREGSLTGDVTARPISIADGAHSKGGIDISKLNQAKVGMVAAEISSNDSRKIPLTLFQHRQRGAISEQRHFRASRHTNYPEVRLPQRRPESVGSGRLGLAKNSDTNFRFPDSIGLDGAGLGTSVGPVPGGSSNSL